MSFNNSITGLYKRDNINPFIFLSGVFCVLLFNKSDNNIKLDNMNLFHIKLDSTVLIIWNIDFWKSAHLYWKRNFWVVAWSVQFQRFARRYSDIHIITKSWQSDLSSFFFKLPFKLFHLKGCHFQVWKSDVAIKGWLKFLTHGCDFKIKHLF